MGEGINRINEKLTSFKKRYYLNLLIRGSIFALSVILGYYIIAALIEYNLWLGKAGRFTIFIVFFIIVGWTIILFLKEPLAWWLYKKGLGEEESARLIGKLFPSVGDKLLNVIQLASSNKHSALLDAGIIQKSVSFQDIKFETAINLNENKRYLKYLLIPFILLLVLFIVDKGIFTQSTSRIVKFNQEFSPQAPFNFIIRNENLEAYFNEDFTLTLQLEGNAIPESAYILSETQRWKMENDGTGSFHYTFEKLQNEISFQVEASGFVSEMHLIKLINRPELTQLKVNAAYPKYLNRNPESFINTGNIEVPEGTQITWQVGAANTISAKIIFSTNQSENDMQLVDNERFNFSKNVNSQEQYSIVLENEKSQNKDKINYSIGIIKDQFPQIVVQSMRDSILYKSIFLGGKISDDYGLTSLKLNYQITRNNKELPVNQTTIPISPNQPQQNFYYQWSLDSLHLEPGDILNYFVQVWDNDGVNGRKSTRSGNYTFNIPTNEEIKDQINKSENSAENRIEQSLQKAKDLKQSIEEAQQKLRGKQNLDWQDKKMLEDLIQQREKLDETIQNLLKENEQLEKKKESFSEESQRIREKSEQIQKLMNELLDDETKKMFQELEKLLKENADANQIKNMLDKMDRKEINLEKEMERTLELFKQLKYEYKVEQTLNDLKEQISEQEELLNKTENLDSKKEKGNEDKDKEDGKSENQNLAEEQESLQEKFNEFEKSLKELEELGNELNKQTNTPDEQDRQDVKDAQENSKQELQKGNPKKSLEQQKKSINQMKEMQQEMESMQSSMEMEIDMQNLESLRQILHGLIKLSFDQESLMKNFNSVQQTDPKYLSLTQLQLKLKEDAKVLEDSLLSLARKDAFLGSIVTKEVGELNDHVDKAVDNIKERRKGNASSEMQFSMTSINNLALMLNDHYNMMMDMMANAKPGMGKMKKGKMQPSLGKMQEMLNQQMEEIRKGGKTGRELSEEMARMAAEQERIRRALQEMQEQLKNNGGQIPGGDLPGKMEQTEFDLVNKQITEQTIRRQKEILTRLLDAEKSMREQDQDEERKGETAKDYSKEIPREFEEYLKLKEKEVELLKTVPPKLYPYYKKEVNDYFKRIGTNE